jgi:catecholate siderophore receptor
MSPNTPIVPAGTKRRLLCSAIAFSLSAGIVHAAADTSADSDADPYLLAAADDAPRGSSRARKMEEIEVQGQAPVAPASPKYTQPLLDTPQSIAVVPNEVISGQNLLSLRDILSTLPGITFGAGEGGGGYGDSIVLRGFTANSDIAIDGVRDSAQYTRTDPFNLEQLEVVNGANSVYSGSGSVGGTINLISKRAKDDAFTRLYGAAGTDSYGRITVDTNQRLGDSTAVRLNVMAHQNDVPGRDVETFERWGIAPSITFGIGSDTQVSLSYVHQEDDNIPQYGVPFFNGGPLPGVNPEHYFGFSNVDTQEIDTDVFTAIIDHAFSDTFSMRSLVRQGETDQFAIVNPPQGTFCLADGTNPATGAACNAPNTYTPSGPRGNLRDATNGIFANQTDFLVDFNTGGVEHNAVIGFSIAHERFDLDTGNIQRLPTGGTMTYAATSLGNPDHIYRGSLNYIRSSVQEAELDARAIYAFDTLHFNEQWSLNAGVRFERSEGEHRTDAYVTDSISPRPLGSVTPGELQTNDDDLLSFRGGLVYKPVDNASVYVAVGNSKTPSKTSVNGACTPQTCNVDPETAVSYELGGKWDVLDARLSLTASLFRNDRENYKVASGDPTVIEQQLDGEARVDGLMLGASGQINDHWLVYANYAHLRSEVLQGASDFVAGNGQDYTRGDRLTNVPEHSLSLWTTYDLGSKWQFGYGATYQGKVWLTQHSVTNPDGPLVTYGDYWTHRAMAAYRVARNLRLQLNVTNLFDEAYYTRPRNNGWATPGDGRSFVLGAEYAF